ncbi:MAG: helix-turn-helix transcriptional regulator [Acidobacteria bacterium]|nr:helix-turn-helix transcriptional regulator [Acidobacteriota bacterium]MCB9399177.1 helix-turn-helix transcriptional regulator [Acidobacteriota bacterium]
MPLDELRDPALLKELGARLAQIRIQTRLTQAELAERAGISLPTLTRFENGASIQLSNFLRILRALDLLGSLELVFPQSELSPIQLLEQQQQEKPKRVRKATQKKSPAGWTWDDPT